MEEDLEAVVSTQKKLSAAHDPGWNDPPSWTRAQLQNSTGGTPAKRILNKRIAFPLNYTSETAASSLNKNLLLSGNLPPTDVTTHLTTVLHKPINTPTAINIENSNSKIQINKVKVLQDILNNFQELMQCHLQDSTKIEEIQKRLDRMKIMWNENKLNCDIQKKLLEISEALKDSNFKKANEIHLSLIMNNASICSSWIPGIRQLINEIKN